MKCCEYCGGNYSSIFYRFIAELVYTIHLHNPQVERIDKENRIVYLTNGNSLDYSGLISSEHAVTFRELIPHIFCSEECEDRFIRKFASIYRSDIHETVLMINWEKEGLFSPVSLLPEQFEHRKDICKVCSTVFPNYSKSYTTFDIADFRIENGNLFNQDLLESKPSLLAHEIIISDMCEDNTYGKYYIYKKGMYEQKYLFCSNDCAYEYCKRKNSLALVKTNIEKGFILAITPHMVEINKMLKSVYKYKPLEYESFSNN